ncbi:MAG: ABC transporter permease [Firmicutes bacterium]|nr:ABC transporter permease [Bacillota bacterium]
MLRRIATLIRKDLLEFCFSKSWIIVLMMPLFIGFLYLVVYKQAETKNFTIAYTPNTDPTLVEVIKSSQINISLYPNQNTAKSALKRGCIDGVLIDNPQSKQLSLLVDKTRAQEGILIVNTVNLILINATSRQGIPQINLIYTNEQPPTRWLSFPVWLLQIILTVCLLQASAAIADEKEKQTLHSLFISPMSIMEYLIAKIIWFIIIGVTAIFLTIAITKAPIDPWYVLLFGVVGSFTFGSLSLLIGLLAPTALFARAIATVSYLVAALPLMVRDLSFSWKEGLYLFPSFLIVKGFEKALSISSNSIEILFWLTGLLLQATVFLSITEFYLQKKADF